MQMHSCTLPLVAQESEYLAQCDILVHDKRLDLVINLVTGEELVVPEDARLTFTNGVGVIRRGCNSSIKWAPPTMCYRGHTSNIELQEVINKSKPDSSH